MKIFNPKSIMIVMDEICKSNGYNYENKIEDENLQLVIYRLTNLKNIYSEY